MNNFSSTDMVIIFVLIAIIFVLILAIILLDIMNKKRNADNLEKMETDDSQGDVTVSETDSQVVMPIEDNNLTKVEPSNVKSDEKSNHIEEIKYVEEDEELERTNAKMELEQLKVELRLQEEQQKEDSVNRVNESEEKTSVDPKPVEKQEEVSSIAEVITEQVKSEEISEANLAKVNAVQQDLNEILESGIEEQIAKHEDEQEEKAIISVEELNKLSDEVYDANENFQTTYQDEGNEPITLMELEDLYNTRELETVKLDDFNTIAPESEKVVIKEDDIKRLEDLPPIAMEHKFKSSPFISPVYGISENKESLELEQTANLDKLNDEIKKTNEFLKTLKELQKNLD